MLLSDEFRYFGVNRYAVQWQEYPKLRARLLALRIGERVNHAPEVAEDLRRLVAELFASSDRTLLGEPTHRVTSRCAPDDGESCFC